MIRFCNIVFSAFYSSVRGHYVYSSFATLLLLMIHKLHFMHTGIGLQWHLVGSRARTNLDCQDSNILRLKFMNVRTLGFHTSSTQNYKL